MDYETDQYINANKDMRNRIIILILTLVFSILFIFYGVMSIEVQSEPNYDGDSHYISGTLSLGTNSIYMNSNSALYYRITPSSYGTYKISSSNATSGRDPYAVLYDASWNELTRNDDGAGALNFAINYYMYPGSTYYLKIAVNGSSSYGGGTLYVTLEQL